MSAIVIRRFELPPVPVADGVQIAEWVTAGYVEAGAIEGEVLRFAYFDPIDARDDVEISFEVRINGLTEGCGVCDVLSEDPEVLRDLAAVCTATAAILRGHQGVTSDAG